MAKKDDGFNTMSNVRITKECYKKIKILSIEKDMSVQEIVSEILEKVMSKKNLSNFRLEE